MLARRIAVVTGATSGIGRAVAIGLAERGCVVHLLGRNTSRGRTTERFLNRRHSPGTATFHAVDLGDFDAVRQTAAVIAASAEPIDVLINAAGARIDRYSIAASGIEATFAANHLGHFLLTCLLLPRLLASLDARVVTISSGAHGGAVSSALLFDGPPSTYDRRRAYAGSKMANVLFAYELARRVQGTTVVSIAYDPGGVASRFASNNGMVSWLRHLLAHALHGGLISARTAARGVLQLALEPVFRNASGKYFRQTTAIRSAPPTYDLALAAQLWSTSVEMTGTATILAATLPDRAGSPNASTAPSVP